MGIADFCMDPILYTTQVVPRSIYNVTVYYTECIGENPVIEPLAGTVRFVNQYSAYINTLYNSGGSCYHNTYLADSLQQLQWINSTVQNITLAASCASTKSEVSNLLEYGLCDDVIQGIYVIWLGQYLTTALLFVCSIILVFAYQYYGTYWNDADVSTRDAPPDEYMDTAYGHNSGSIPMQLHPAAANIVTANPAYVGEVHVQMATPMESGRQSLSTQGSGQYAKTLPT